MENMKKVCFIYPHITSYVLPLIYGMAESCKLDVVYGSAPLEEGFGKHDIFVHPNVSWTELKTISPFGKYFGMYQRGIITHIFKNRPNAIVFFGNPRYISFWFVLIIGKILKIEVYPSGHGLFKKKKPSILIKLMYRIIIALSTKYLCYTESVKKSLASVGNEGSLLVDNNTLYNSAPILPAEKNGNEPDVFFIGRLRSRCGIEELIDAIRIMRSRNKNIDLHIIGDGPLSNLVISRAESNPWVHYHGQLFEDSQIREVSRSCRIGCYPGDMGLSVVHMLSLCLPPVTHNSMNEHMGPEPSYIQDGINGFFYSPKLNITALVDTLFRIWNLPTEQIRTVQKAAYSTYTDLSTPPLHRRILQNINC